MLQDGETMRHGLALSFESSDLDEEDEKLKSQVCTVPPSIGWGMIQKDSESKDSLSIPHFISVTVNKYPGQNNNDNNNNNNNFGGKRICFSSQVQVTAQWCREGKVTRTQSYWLHHTQESRAERNERMLAGSVTCLCLLGLNS